MNKLNMSNLKTKIQEKSIIFLKKIIQNYLLRLIYLFILKGLDVFYLKLN